MMDITEGNSHPSDKVGLDGDYTMIKTSTAFFAAANGKRVRKQVTGVATIEQWPAILENAISQLKAQGAIEGKDYRETETGLEYGQSGGSIRFMRKPALVADETGVLTVRSADYAFKPDRLEKPIYGEKKGSQVNGQGQLVKTYDSGMIVTFTILESL